VVEEAQLRFFMPEKTGIDWNGQVEDGDLF
jgi:hypothetical protein